MSRHARTEPRTSGPYGAFRVPGATLLEVPPRSAPPPHLVLERVLHGLEHLDAAPAPATAVRGCGTGPVAVAVPVMPADPATAVLEGERQKLLIAGAFYAAGQHAEPPLGSYCPACKTSVADWCDDCADRVIKASGYYKLHDLIAAAPSLQAALTLLGTERLG